MDAAAKCASLNPGGYPRLYCLQITKSNRWDGKQSLLIIDPLLTE